MLKTRIITAIVIVAISLLAIYLSLYTRIALGLVVYLLINYEFLSFATVLDQQKKMQFLTGLILIPLGFLWNSWSGLSAGIVVTVILSFLFQLIEVEREEHLLPFEKRIPSLCLAITYTGIIGSLFVISAKLFSADKLVYVISLVAITDTFAYFVGRLIGGPKFSPRISPNKTVAGVVGGLLAAAIASPFLAHYFQIMGNGFIHVALGICLGFLVIFGDLLESCMKRIYQAKDSGSLLPGHGGVLDRVDGLMLALVVLFFLK